MVLAQDFSKMNRGFEVTTESENAEKLKQQLNESDDVLRREIDELKNEVKVL
jgi:hypothetical protein